jgi:recombination protein RecR
MDAYTESMTRLIAEFGKLPGIGRRTAERLAFHLLDADRPEAESLAQAVRDIKTRIGRCGECGGLAEGERCPICASPRRDRSRICVVERPRDVIRLEAAGGYDGLYHVLGGLLAPVEGQGPEELDVAGLERRIAEGDVEEVVFALSPTAEGDGTVLYVADRLKETGVRMTRLARGIPTGATLDYASHGVLADALRGRQDVE